MEKSGVCQSAQNGPFWKFFNHIFYKIQIERGSVLCKKIANSCIWGPILWAVLKNWGSADRPRMHRFEKFSTFSHTKSEFKGGLFYEKMPYHVSGALQCGPFWTNGGVGQSAQTGPIFLTFKNIFLYKIKIQSGYLLWKKLPSHLVRAPCGGPFWTNAWLLTRQIWADQFLIILNLKCKIILGQFYAKSCYRPKLA